MALHLLALLIGGAALLNALPHLFSGSSGRRFPTPFARPPGKGLSSAPTNVAWGFANLAAAYGLICRAGDMDLQSGVDVTAVGAGALALGLYLSVRFGRLAE